VTFAGKDRYEESGEKVTLKAERFSDPESRNLLKVTLWVVDTVVAFKGARSNKEIIERNDDAARCGFAVDLSDQLRRLCGDWINRHCGF
jgi:hypothetical protein